jgi:lipopolysaccharide/colanic/teichoic acid biosynthesis glycosyltransferase
VAIERHTIDSLMPALTRRIAAQRLTDQPALAEDRRFRPHAVSEELFKSVLVRERKRTDRSNLPVILLLIEPREGVAGVDAHLWSAAIDALSGVKRETDVLGWLDRERTLGVICPEIQFFDGDIAIAIEDRFRRELDRRLGADAARKLAVQLHVYPEPKPAADGAAAPAFPYREPEQPPTAYDALKRALDVAASVTLLALLSPLMLVIAALVKLTSRGPVFFPQVRIGRHMEPFKMLKFRTMRVNADHTIHQEFVSSFIKSSGKNGAAATGFFKIVDDPRITRIGHILRKTSIDELPQLWNVVRGHMSLVGPRPPLPYEVQEYQRWHCRRVIEAKPGITGLWQVTGRSRTTFDEMVRLDLRYAKSRSLATDLKILLATPKAVIAGRGAC